MQLEIIKHQGIGPIRFGMNVNEVRQLFNAGFDSFMRTTESAHPADHFVDLGVIVSYKADGSVDAVEVFEPAAPIWKGINLLETPFRVTCELLSESDPNLEINVDGVTSRGCGVGVWAPDTEEDERRPKAVIVFERGYYD